MGTEQDAPQKIKSNKMKFFKVSTLATALASAAMANPLASIDNNVETGTTSDITDTDYTESNVNFDKQTTSAQPEDPEALQRTLQLVPGYGPLPQELAATFSLKP